MRAIDFTAKVLAKPGTPSMTAWPPQINTSNNWSTTSRWPVTTYSISARTCWERDASFSISVFFRDPRAGIFEFCLSESELLDNREGPFRSGAVIFGRGRGGKGLRNSGVQPQAVDGGAGEFGIGRVGREREPPRQLQAEIAIGDTDRDTPRAGTFVKTAHGLDELQWGQARKFCRHGDGPAASAEREEQE